jgi:hypothetical protein
MAYRAKTRSRRKRSTHRKASPRRRRRIGGIGKRRENGMRLIGLVAGAVAPAFIGMIKINGNPIDPKIVGGASLVVGYLLPTFIKGDLAAGVGDGMIASGGVTLLKEFNVISGIPIIAGWQDMKTINGTGKPADTLKEMGQTSVFRPSVSQVMNGMYSRRYDD